MMFYLIEHNRNTKKTEHWEYREYRNAQICCLKKEKEHLHNQRDEMEVVIFEAHSIEDLKKTHSRYFAKKNHSNSDVLLAAGAVGLVGLAAFLLIKK